MAEVLAYIFYFLSSTSSTLQRRELATRRTDDSGQIDFAFRVMFITFVLSAVLLVFKKPVLSQSPLALALLALVCGVSGAVSIASQYIAQRHVEAGVTTLVGNVYTPVSIILASLFLNEGLKTRQIFGTVILLGAVIMVSNKHRLSRWRFDRYFWLMVINGLALGFTLTAERALIKDNSLPVGTWISWGSQSLCLAIAALLAGTKSQYGVRDTATTGGLRFLQQVSWVILVTNYCGKSKCGVGHHHL
ncbi:MAG TPA: DMT family transporter [Candidatus Saccharimonadales bacterium]|nr:DMT family transporter [Candidatus Saccharimonadales bacterium]